MGGSYWLIRFNTFKIKLVTFHHHWVEPEILPIIMDGCARKGRLLTLNIYFDSSSFQASSGTPTSDPLPKNDQFILPILLLYFYQSQIRWKMMCCCHISPQLPVLIEFKIVYVKDQNCTWLIIFLPTTSFLTDKILQASCCSITITMVCVLTFHSPTTHDFYNWDWPCHIHKCESFPFHLYSISNE